MFDRLAELETELEIRIIRAEAEVETIKVRYPEPHDVSLIPVQVQRAFRGVKETTLMLDGRAPGIAVEPGELYLIRGARMPDTPFRLPDIPDAFDYDLYVIPLHATPVSLSKPRPGCTTRCAAAIRLPMGRGAIAPPCTGS